MRYHPEPEFDSRLHALLETHGYRINKKYTRGAKIFFEATHSDHEWSNALFRFAIDPSMHVLEALADAPGNAKLDLLEAVCPVLDVIAVPAEDVAANAVLTALPESQVKKSRKKKKGWWEQEEEKKARRNRLYELRRLQQVRNVDSFYEQGIASGKAILVVPVQNLDLKYDSDELLSSLDLQSEFWADRSYEALWRKADGNEISVGYLSRTGKLGMQGFTHAFLGGQKRYLVYLVEPGEYRLTGGAVELKLHTKPAVQLVSDFKPGNIGTVSFHPFHYTDYYKTQAWQDAEYSNRYVRETYCAAVFSVAPNMCARSGEWRGYVKEKVAEAGFVDSVRAFRADGVRMETELAKPFASFTISSGEVLLTDSLLGQHPFQNFDTTKCQATGVAAKCALELYALVHVRADRADLANESFIRVTQEYPRLRQLLERITYRPLQLEVPSGPDVPGLGEVRILK